MSLVKPLVKPYQPPVIPHSWGIFKKMGDTPISPGRRTLLHFF